MELNEQEKHEDQHLGQDEEQDLHSLKPRPRPISPSMGKRVRLQSEKGKMYNFDLLVDELKKQKRLLGKINKEADLALSKNDCNVGLLQDVANRLQIELKNIDLTLSKVKESEIPEVDIVRSLEYNYQEICFESHTRLTILKEKMKHEQEDRMSNVSQRSKSSSSRSHHTSGSKSSRVSSTKRIELSTKLARLGTERKYHDIMEKARADLKKLEIDKEIEATNAEICAVNKILEEENETDPQSCLSFPLGENKQPTEGLLHRYLEDSRVVNYSLSGSSVQKSLSFAGGLDSIDKDLDKRKAEIKVTTDLNPNAQVFRFPTDFIQPGKPRLDHNYNYQPIGRSQPSKLRLGQETNLNSDFKIPNEPRLGCSTIDEASHEVVGEPRLIVDPKNAVTCNTQPDVNRPRLHAHEPLTDFHEQPNIINNDNVQSSQVYQWDILKGFADLQNQNLEKLANLFAARQRKDNLPAKEPEVFSGDLLKYPQWKASFITLIEYKTDDAAERLYYLGKYTDGQAKTAIDNLISFGTQEAYDKAWKILHDRFGNKFIVADTFRSKLEGWPKITINDGPGLRKFSDFLEHCKTAMGIIKYLAILNDPKENKLMLQKLPAQIAERWNCIVTKRITIDEEEYPSFEEFTRFISDEANKACNPTSSYSALNRRDTVFTPKEKQPQSKVARRTSFATKFNEVNNVTNAASDENKSKNEKQTESKMNVGFTCYYCRQNHDMEKCPEFLKLDLAQRNQYLTDKKMCRGCFKIGHYSRYCKRPRKCIKCKRWHPTILHDENLNKKPSSGDTQQEQAVAVANRINVNRYFSADVHSMIVPVWLSHRNTSNKVMVYAVLDDQSDACFIKESVLRYMNVNGQNSVIKIATMLGEEAIKSTKVFGLSVKGINENSTVNLPCVYSRKTIPARRAQIPKKCSALRWPHLKKIAGRLVEYNPDIEIGLLIGINCIKAVKPLEIIPGSGNEPYGQRTALGWGIIGNVNVNENNLESDVVVNRTVVEEIEINSMISNNIFTVPTKVKEVYEPHHVREMFESDFISNVSDDEVALSVEERQFIEIVSNGIKIIDGKQLKIPLPLKGDGIQFPDNKLVVQKRLSNLKQKLQKNVSMKNDYINFMKNMIDKGYAERVPLNETCLTNGKVWFVPHHGVYHPRKTDKIRVVFDCSFMYKNVSLNDCLLQGPDLSNSLAGILCRFRNHSVAFTCDVEAMYHQVLVNEEHRNLLRFLWFDNHDLDGDIVQYRMTVHLFGARSSPSVANYDLKAAADRFKDKTTEKAAEFIKEDFYVDDGLKSVATVEEAINLAKDSQMICKRGGFHLHKFVANNAEVLKAMCPDEVAQSVKNLDLTKDKLPVERTLGMEWCTETDTFNFNVKPIQRPSTRRNVLSIVSSIFDPLGMISPFILTGKKVLQTLCKQDLGWDDPIPETVIIEWENWLSQLPKLKDIKVERCYKPANMNVIDYELHHFSDASEKGYGQCSYLRMTDANGQVHTRLVMAKSRVSPLKTFTIPRLELTAALASVKVSYFLKKELKVNISKEVFWVDSTIVLGYIANQCKQFKVFVANRVAQIRNHTLPEQWRYVSSNDNPADLCSRGMSVHDLTSNYMWWHGPEFLKHDNADNETLCSFEVTDEDPELKKVSLAINTDDNNYATILTRLNYFSDWTRARRSLALCNRFIDKLKQKSLYTEYVHVSVEELIKAEITIIKLVQREAFQYEYQLLSISNNKFDKCLRKSSNLYKLDPFIGSDGLIRVGGRLNRSNFYVHVKYPVILPKNSHITELIICHYHNKVHHQGRNLTLNEIRSSGYWIISGSSLVAKHISKCVTCRKIRHDTLTQKMADLPKDRVEMSSPFTYSAVDYLGPFIIKEGRKELKRYGVLFTCMSTRAIHIETAHSLSTDSFLNAYRRFVCRRGHCAQLRSDQGSNFIGAREEFAKCLREMKVENIKNELLKDQCDFITFKMNPPHASHMGGVWERQIRSVRNILNVLLSNNSKILDDESLRTFMTEAENIVNGRPLSTDNLNDPLNVEPLTPNHFLTLKSKVVLPPPGNFVKEDMFSKKKWRRVQCLLNQLWKR
ncbi:uncharacterized protein [Palaemon carinicauda]|uniref:uncharacterized protein n=1 Tax=Palaemon carinicauda TaxID=392227 RepID=UPI0035B5A832